MNAVEEHEQLIKRLRHRAIYSRTAAERAYWRRALRRNRATPTTLGQLGTVLIKHFESFFAKPYKDPVGVWTIGYGSTKGVNSRSKPLTEPQAAKRLQDEVSDEYAPAVVAAARAAGKTLTPWEFDALVSAVYNLGPGVLEPGRSLGDALRAKVLWRRRVARALLKYDKATQPNGDVVRLAGLTRRRKSERHLFLTGKVRTSW